MNIRAIALAVPLFALGTACQHAQTRGTGATAQGEPSQPQDGTASAPAQGAGGQATGPGAAGAPLEQDPIMRPGPSIQGHAGDGVVSGHIAEVAEDLVSIETDQGDRRELQVVPQTAIEIDGMDASLEDLAEGQPVRASFDEVEGQQVAVKIRAGEAAVDDAGVPTDRRAQDASGPQDQDDAEAHGHQDSGAGASGTGSSGGDAGPGTAGPGAGAPGGASGTGTSGSQRW